MRRLFSSDEAAAMGLTRAALRWGEQAGRWRRVDQGVWAEGPEAVSQVDRARAAVMASRGVASHHLAGVLHGLDSVGLDGTWATVPPTGRREAAVVAATGWLCGRFTWTEVTRTPRSTARRRAELAEQARLRPLAQPARSSSATR